MWPNLDYGDVIYDQPSNSTLPDKIESVESVLTMTNAKEEHPEKNCVGNLFLNL